MAGRAPPDEVVLRAPPLLLLLVGQHPHRVTTVAVLGEQERLRAILELDRDVVLHGPRPVEFLDAAAQPLVERGAVGVLIKEDAHLLSRPPLR